MDGVALAPAGVGRQRHYPKRSSEKIIGSVGAKEPWPQSCWIAKRRTSSKAAGAASGSTSAGWLLAPQSGAAIRSTNGSPY